VNPPSSAIIRPARAVAGSLRLSGDKSISHRYAMLAAIAEGESRLQNFSRGADCASTLECIRRLGRAVRRAGGAVIIAGRGPRLEPPSQPLDCGNSGSTMRMLAGIVAGQEFETSLVGDESLSRRPMGRLIAPLAAMGARIASRDGERPPLAVRGGQLRGIDYRLPVASAQVKSAILFAGLFAKGATFVEEPVPTRDHGELALRAFGAEVSRAGKRAGVAGGQQLRGLEATIPGDISSAAFFLCAAALFPGSQLVIDGLLLNPTRAALLDVLAAMGARFSVIHLEEHHGELVGSVKLEGGRLAGGKIAGAQAAALIDELPVLAAIAPYTEQGIEIRDAAELRVKESDRIAAVSRNLRSMGAQVEERQDGWRVPGGQPLRGADLDSAGDHRIAMAFAVAALRAQGETTIHGADCVAISLPEFFDLLDQCAQR